MIALAAVLVLAVGHAGATLERHARRLEPHPDPAPAPTRPALASWYADHGTGACNVGDVQAGYRFASLILQCGTRVTFRHAGRTVTATMSDHGPYITGRTFDLNANLRSALACPDLCYLQWEIAHGH